ncbi:glycosyltransferase family 4 protein [Planctomycetota bacterium]
MKKICMVGYACYLADPRITKEAEALAQQGMIVDCFCLKEEGQPRSDVVNGVNIYRLPLSKYRGNNTIRYMLTYTLFCVLAFFSVTKSYFKQHYDVIQFHTLPDFIVFAGIIPKFYGVKLLLDMHEIMPEFYMSKFSVGRSHPLIKILTLLERISVWFADAVIVINEPIKRLLLQRCKSKSDMTVVMNCADEKLFRPDRISSPKDSNGLNLMYHGTLTPLYGVQLAVQAVAKLKAQIPGLKFRIFGNEEEAGDLKKLADELSVCRNVIFVGRLPREEMPQYVSQADIGILPTIRDEFVDLSFSNKLAEYICMKIPVVATRLKSTLEYFPEDDISYFESQDVDSLASRIYELYANPRKRVLQAEKAFQHYQRIEWPVMKKRYIELINSLASR